MGTWTPILTRVRLCYTVLTLVSICLCLLVTLFAGSLFMLKLESYQPPKLYISPQGYTVLRISELLANTILSKSSLHASTLSCTVLYLVVANMLTLYLTNLYANTSFVLSGCSKPTLYVSLLSYGC